MFGTTSRAELRVDLRDSVTDFVQDIEIRLPECRLRFSRRGAVNKQQKMRFREVFPLSRRARTQYLPQDQAQVERPHMDQLCRCWDDLGQMLHGPRGENVPTLAGFGRRDARASQ